MSNRNDSLRMAALAAGLGAAYWFGIDRPQQRKLGSLRTELALLREDLALGAARAGDLAELAERMRQGEGAVAEFERRIPRSADLGPFIAELSESADRMGLRERNITLRAAGVIPAEDGRGNRDQGGSVCRRSLVVLPIRMEFVARFDGAFGFLREVEELPRLARVSELRMERPAPFRGELKAELTLQVFYEAA